MANRKIVGLKIGFYHPQSGRPKADAGPDAKAKFNMKDLQPSDDYNSGRSQFNCFAEKCKCAVNGTPQVQNPDGTIVNLEPGDPENADVRVESYTVIFDGVPYTGDDIMKTPIEVNGTDRNSLMPMCVFGLGLSGDHTLGFEMKANGFTARTPSDLRLNG